MKMGIISCLFNSLNSAAFCHAGHESPDDSFNFYKLCDPYVCNDALSLLENIFSRSGMPGLLCRDPPPSNAFAFGAIAFYAMHRVSVPRLRLIIKENNCIGDSLRQTCEMMVFKAVRCTVHELFGADMWLDPDSSEASILQASFIGQLQRIYGPDRGSQLSRAILGLGAYYPDGDEWILRNTDHIELFVGYLSSSIEKLSKIKLPF
jgi:hypothetical protein